jgi:hypothetical protein
MEYNGRAAMAADVAGLHDEWANGLVRALKGN